MTVTNQLWADEIELGWQDAWLHEARGAHGEWVKGPVEGVESALTHGYERPDPARLHSKVGPYPEPQDHPFFKAHPMSPANIVASYKESSPAERAQGMRWYADAHQIAKEIAGGDAAKGAGVLSAYSPQTAWPVNMMNAARALFENRALGPGDGMITGAMQKNAQEILDGDSIDMALPSEKMNSFAHLMADNGDAPGNRAGYVVMDRHAMSVAAGQRLSKDDIQHVKPNGRYYAYMADMYRNAAADLRDEGIDVSPYQLQAITWLHQQNKNQLEDETGQGRGGKGASHGRRVMGQNAWERWEKYARQHHLDLEPGTTALSIVEQALEMAGWRDAWRHELRGPHGEWIKGGQALSGEKYPGEFSYKIGSYWRNENNPDAKQHLNLAGAAFDANDYGETAKQLRLAAETAASTIWSSSYESLADRIEAGAAKDMEGQASDKALADKTKTFVTGFSGKVPGWLGGGTESWNHEVKINKLIEGDPNVLAMLDWDRTMTVRNDQAEHIQTTLDMSKEPVADPQAFSVLLHEMIHGVVQDGNDVEQDKHYYQNPADANIEEGFTELGTVHHMPEYLDAVGIGDRQTGILSAIDGQPVPNPDYEHKRQALHDELRAEAAALRAEAGSRNEAVWIQTARHVDSAADDVDNGYFNSALEELRYLQHLGDTDAANDAHILMKEINTLADTPIDQHATMKEYAQRLQDPVRIAQGDAWGHYPQQTCAAQEWVQEVAKKEAGHKPFDASKPGSPGWNRVRELSDEINRVGTANKVITMADQLARAAGIVDMSPGERSRVTAAIRSEFSSMYDPGGRAAFRKALKVLGELRERKLSVTSQALEMGWNDAWRHELRGPHGEWIKGGATEKSLGSMLGKVKKGFIDTYVGSHTASPEIHKFVDNGSERVPGLLGGGHQAFTGKISVYNNESLPGVLAEMKWNGDMVLRDDVATVMQDGITNTSKPVEFPDAFETVLHELIHADIPEGQSYQEHEQAYQDPANAAIEEGSTELGAIYHAPEFFEQMGMGDREVPILKYGPVDDSGRAPTMAEQARRMQTVDEVARGNAWGHYNGQTAAVQDWLKSVAEAEGEKDFSPGSPGWQRLVALSDELNREGAAGKLDVMVTQIMRTFGYKSSDILARAKERVAITSSIKDAFKKISGPDGSKAFLNAQHAHQAAMAEERRAA